MECAASATVARFRGAKLGQYPEVSDDISGSDRYPRYVTDRMPAKDKIFRRSVEAALTL